MRPNNQIAKELTEKQAINQVLGSQQFTNFDLLYQLVTSLKLDFVPFTWMNHQDFLEYSLQNMGQYVDLSSQKLFKSSDLVTPEKNIQALQFNPLLINKCKFTVKSTVLLTSVCPLSFYL